MSSPAPNDRPQLPAPGTCRKAKLHVSIRRRASTHEIDMRTFSDTLPSIPDPLSSGRTVRRCHPEQCRKHFRAAPVKAIFVHPATEKPPFGS
jgi:hypothetical protein